MTTKFWYALSTYFKQRHGRPVQKIPLDSGAGCPNRDGSISRSGCSFCNALGSGSGLLAKGLDLPAQWRLWREKYGRHRREAFYLAYFQSFSNTYGPADRIRRLIAETKNLPDIIGLSMGTRPDCLDEEKLDILADCPLPEVWLDIGLQSMNNRTLERINRGHGVNDSEKAVNGAAERNIKVCAHLMAGLPGETPDDFLASVAWAVSMPIAGIKLHNLYVPQGTTLAKEYKVQNYIPMQKPIYINTLITALTIIPAHVIIHRLTADPAPGELLAPAWAGEKNALLNEIYHTMAARNQWQACRAGYGDSIPSWY